MAATTLLGLIFISTILMVRGQDAQPVKVSTYYESLCPYSKDFIVNQLYPTYQLVPEIMVAEFVPFGNAEFYPAGDTWNFTCQHGPEECVGNEIHACALYYYPDNAHSVPFIACSMSSLDPVTGSEQCAIDNGMDWETISSCANSDLGRQLVHDYGVQTQSLQPPMGGTPWILFDDVYNSMLYNYARTNLLLVVCDLYQGTKPDNC